MCVCTFLRVHRTCTRGCGCFCTHSVTSWQSLFSPLSPLSPVLTGKREAECWRGQQPHLPLLCVCFPRRHLAQCVHHRLHRCRGSDILLREALRTAPGGVRGCLRRLRRVASEEGLMQAPLDSLECASCGPSLSLLPLCVLLPALSTAHPPTPFRLFPSHQSSSMPPLRLYSKQRVRVRVGRGGTWVEG